MWNSFRAIAALSLCLGVGVAGASAQTSYPERQVELVIGAGPGGGTDFMARQLGDRLSKKWGQPVVVMNQPGASETIAAAAVANANPDGYTLLLQSLSFTIVPTIRKLEYDPIKNFAPITQIAYVPSVLIVSTEHTKVKTLKELIDLGKAEPGKLTFGSNGPGTTAHLLMGLLMKQTGIDMVAANYQSAGEDLTALLGGEIDVMFSSLAGAGELIKDGKLTALAISSKDRSASLPDVPTVAEAAGLPDYDETGWFGLYTTAGAPKEIVDKIYADINEIKEMPDFKEALAARGFVMMKSVTPDEFQAFLKNDLTENAEVMKSLGVEMQ